MPKPSASKPVKAAPVEVPKTKAELDQNRKMARAEMLSKMREDMDRHRVEYERLHSEYMKITGAPYKGE